MKRLRSHVEGRWRTASSRFVPLVNPCSEQVIAEASSEGVDFAAALDYARRQGGPALRELNIAGRADLLDRMSRTLHEHRDELIALSLENTGTTRKDAKFDIDGATFTLSHYGGVGQSIGGRDCFLDGEGTQLGRSSRFWGQHVLVPRAGVAVFVNAFNFPAWGIAEKAACALLAGMPVIVKPATSSALVAERCVEIVVEAGILPDGALSLVCGSAGDLLDHLGRQDVLAFTGSASTALQLRGKANLLASSTRVNVEADSLNAAVLGADVEPGSESWDLFLRDVEREITQKSGQKCTAVRRILASADRIERVQADLAERLARLVVGNPLDPSVTMGPLATADQLREASDGVARLCEAATRVHGTGERIDGVGNEPGKGFFFGPTLLRAEEAGVGSPVHEIEVFGPVATLIPYDGTASDAAKQVSLGGGCLVTSVYTDELAFLSSFLRHGGSTSGRLYIGSEKVASQLPGSGLALPQLLHGGPGRAGGGEELGGLRGLELYLQRVALSGDRALVERLAGAKGSTG
jgi:oxepin-CoA hydrolase/3-oxo-5,6-dehydrosuberyl-CoA semialdehyde dehydrogenase